MTTHDIRTTFRPDLVITVDESEYQQLLAEHLVYDGTPPDPVADSYDALFADKIVNGEATPAALRAAFDARYVQPNDAAGIALVMNLIGI